MSKKYASAPDRELARIFEKWGRNRTPEMYNFPAPQNHSKTGQTRATTKTEAIIS
jgi:hypothetical protein